MATWVNAHHFLASLYKHFYRQFIIGLPLNRGQLIERNGILLTWLLSVFLRPKEANNLLANETSESRRAQFQFYST